MKNFNEYTDDELMCLLKAGNRKAFERIYTRYWPRLFDDAYRRIKSKEAAEEIVQDLFTYLWCKREAITLNYSFSTYINVALKYKVFNYIRDETKRQNSIQIAHHLQPAYHHAVNDHIAYNELRDLIEKEINQLPEKCRLVFTLSRDDNFSFKEIAKELNISISTVEKHVGKALKTLRTNLKDHIALALYFLLS